jgi:hypothetical protein
MIGSNSFNLFNGTSATLALARAKPMHSFGSAWMSLNPLEETKRLCFNYSRK